MALTKKKRMIKNYQYHSNKVRDWIESVTPGLSPPELIELFEFTITKLWSRSCIMIGDVTLLAILDRVLASFTETHKISFPLSIDSAGIRWDNLRKSGAKLKPDEIILALTYFATEFIAIAGSITGDLLSGPLHKELETITLKNNNTGGNRE